MFQLWPENSPYQVYVPGYHNAMPANGGAVPRARSVSPEAAQGLGLPSEHPRGRGPPGGILYAELQFPATSNYGSMKKRSQRDRTAAAAAAASSALVDRIEAAGGHSGNTTTTTSVNSGEPSPTNMMQEGFEAAGSMDSVHRYVPDYVAVSTRKTAV